MLDWVDEQLGGKKGDGYPVAITGSGVLQMEQVDGRLAVLTDTALLLYNDNGGELVRRSTRAIPIRCSRRAGPICW